MSLITDAISKASSSRIRDSCIHVCPQCWRVNFTVILLLYTKRRKEPCRLTLVLVMLYWMVLITTRIRRLPREISVKTRSEYQVIFFSICDREEKFRWVELLPWKCPDWLHRGTRAWFQGENPSASQGTVRLSGEDSRQAEGTCSGRERQMETWAAQRSTGTHSLMRPSRTFLSLSLSDTMWYTLLHSLVKKTKTPGLMAALNTGVNDAFPAVIP